MPVQTLQSFYNAINTYGGFLTQHQFQLYIPNLNNGQVVYVQSAELPGKAITTGETHLMGFPIKVATGITYTQEWPITVRCDQGMSIRTSFENWSNQIASLAANAGGALGTLASNVDAQMYLLGEDNQTIEATYILKGVYPTNIGATTFEQGSNGIATFNVTLTFQYWYNQADGDPIA